MTKRTRPCRKPNLSSTQGDSDGSSTSSPAWLLSLPDPCLESVLKHCASDLPGVQGLTSLLRCSRATYDALSTAAYEAIDPGCVAAWASLAEDYNVQLQAVHALVLGSLSAAQWRQEVEAREARTGSRRGTAGDGAGSSSGAGRTADSAAADVRFSEELQVVRRTTALQVLSTATAGQPQRRCLVRPAVRALWQAAIERKWKTTMDTRRAIMLGLSLEQIHALPHARGEQGEELSWAYDPVAAHCKALEVHGPGTLRGSLPQLVRLVEQDRGLRRQVLLLALRGSGVTLEELQLIIDNDYYLRVEWVGWVDMVL